MDCKNCHTEFNPKQQHQCFCSRKCGVSFKNKEYRRRLKESGIKRERNRTTYFINKPCRYCNEIIGHRYKATQEYCSTGCAAHGQKKYLDIPSCLKDASRKLDRNLGYVRVYVPMHPEANSWGYVYEHRVIAEMELGRRLRPDEVVHHKNGKRWDNSPDNLEVMFASDHSRHHATHETNN